MTNPRRIFYLYNSVIHVVNNNIKGDIVEMWCLEGWFDNDYCINTYQEKNQIKKFFYTIHSLE